MENNEIGIIDIGEALKRVLGHKDMYKRWLETFFDPQTMEVVHDAFNRKDYADAHKTVHKLKGTAANLSVNRVAEQARVLDDMIKAETPFADMEQQLRVLQETYDEAEMLYYSNPTAVDEYVI